MRPTPELWSAAVEPLQGTLKQLGPQVILVLGVELAQHLPAISDQVAVCRLRHPSSFGFSYKSAHARILETFASIPEA